ncbi:MAG: signal peptidase I [Bacteroidota bacterium]
MSILLFFIISYVLLSASLYRVFDKANVQPTKAFIPGVNFVAWCQIIGRPKWWPALLLIPLVNVFIFAGMCVDMIRSFKKYSFGESFKAVVYAPFAFFQIGNNLKEQYDGPSLRKERAYLEKIEQARQEKNTYKLKKLVTKNPYQKTALRDWTEAVVFAVFAAAFIRLFTIEAYAIPTSSMEGSLNVGDHLFVSKIHYGLRTPSTVLMIPLLHNRIPYINRESYLKNPNLPHYRLPALEKLDRNKPVVFNMPEGDSVYITPERSWSSYDVRRNAVPSDVVRGIEQGRYSLVTRPIDKIDHYVKHCIGLPGETLQIKDRQVFVNDQAVTNPKNLQYRYLVKFPRLLNERKFSDWGITKEDQQYYNAAGPNHKMLVLNETQKAKIQAMDKDVEFVLNDMYWVSFPIEFDRTQLADLGINNAHIRASSSQNRLLMTLSPNQKNQLQQIDNQIAIERYNESDRLFPHDPVHFDGWNVDNYGPVWIPKSGETIDLSTANIAMYRRAIEVYENNDLRIEGDQIFINGEVTSQYTFQLDYYWMMGDNRNNSEDSRMWGFVPQTHILGKPLFIYFSTKENDIFKGINWNRMFTSASKAE